MTLSEPAPTNRVPVPKSLAGLTFVIFWAIAIVLWSITHLFVGHALQGFLVDAGIVFASVGLAAPFLLSMKGYRASLVLGFIGIVLFAVFGFGEVTVLVYTLRFLVPLLALLTPLYKLTSFRIFA